MRKIIYVCLLALLAVSFGCQKEEVQTEEPNTESIILSKRDYGFGGENGAVSGNNAVCPPNTPYDTHIITYQSSWSELDKEIHRLIYFDAGILLCYIESTTDSLVETWYVVEGSVSCNSQFEICQDETGGKGNPPVKNFP